MGRKRGKAVVLISLILILGIGGFFSFQKLRFEESISSILPSDSRHQFLVEILDSASFFDRLVFHIHLEDTTATDPKLLAAAAAQLADSIEQHFMPQYVQKIEGRIDPGLQRTLMENFFTYLPFYLSDKEYEELDSLILYRDMEHLLKEHLKRLNSPAGMVLSRFIFRDPLGLSSSQMRHLEDLRLDRNLKVYSDFLLTNDEKNLLFFVTPTDASNTGESKVFINALDRTIENIKQAHFGEVSISYIGSLPIANANAIQIKKDIQLTVSIAIILVVFLIYYFFRRKRILLLILLPALFGAYVAIVIMGITLGAISMISLGIGSVMIGISVDYSLHYFTHLKHAGKVKESSLRIAEPVLMSSLTTASAFLCLLLLSSPGMRQLGIFAAISVLSAALLSVVFVPYFLKDSILTKENARPTFIEKLAAYEPKKKGFVFLLLIIISGIMYFFSQSAGFEKDIEKSNYMPPHLAKADRELQAISSIHQKKIYLLSEGNTLDAALENLEKHADKLATLRNQDQIGTYHGIYSLIPSTKKQQNRLDAWNQFWTPEKVNLLQERLGNASQKVGFKQEAFSGFYRMLESDFQVIPPEDIMEAFGPLVKDFRITVSDRTLIATLVNTSSEDEKENLTKAFMQNEDALVFDRKDFFLRIFDTIQSDFDKLIRFSLILVFLILLIFFGRIELAIISFIPIVLSWVWTLGFMGITNIKLNYFNIVICTLIFGLGVDYSIFITKGLIRKYSRGSSEIISFRSSILISFFTTITGLGVLILARHPALKSIATVSIIGIVSVIIISFTLQPLLFKFLTESRQGLKKYPVTLGRFLFSLVIFLCFGVLSIILSLSLPVFMILPLPLHKRRYAARAAACYGTRVILNMYPALRVKKRNINKSDFDNPSVIVCNHQSMIDILIFLSLSPKILILTKDWVWNNPVFGLMVRFSGHMNIAKGYEENKELMQKRISEGCSILTFPEGSRTPDGSIKRYHKGGFLMAQEFDLPLLVLMMHGAYEGLPKGSFLFTPGRITLSKLYHTQLDKTDPRAYYHASKKICADTRIAFDQFYRQEENIQFYRQKILGNYLFKGPILEHYMRIKLRLENNYNFLNTLIPHYAKITDIGCGYGAVSFMLSLRSPKREINGIDYDEAKVEIAQQAAISHETNTKFFSAHALKFDYGFSDVFLISDMLHYLPADNQEVLLEKCLNKLNSEGKIIIRDSDSSLQNRHWGTQLSEFFSTKLRFNKTENPLQFVSREFIAEIAKKHDLSLNIIDRTKYNSNVIYILERK